MSYIGKNELITYNDDEMGIFSGGFSVKSIMLNQGISPIMTLNNNVVQNGGSEKVSDIFNDLVVPNWAFSLPNKMMGGSSKNINKHKSDKDKYDKDKDDSSDSSDEEIDDDLHDKLLDLVREYDTKQNKKKTTKKNIKNRIKGTRKNKINKII